MKPQPREEQLDEIIAAYLQASEAGLSPDREELVARHPDLASELRTFFADQDEFAGQVTPLRRLAPAPVSGPTPLPPRDGSPDVGDARTFGDYELLEELGRGGMGVVYKARQQNPQRLVALKMMLAGPFASPADAERFRREADAAASLDHPHIVPIYEVGEHDGRAYFSMKLVAGGSLAQHLPHLRQDLRASARLLATVARAVHYAHQRGLLHRDLKPANILLEMRNAECGMRNEEEGTVAMASSVFRIPHSAFRIPYVTDFGLAKQLPSPESGSSELTPSGTTLGTPAYMAPEQASGRKGAVTTAADVYSLGTILYEMLTGRPPFRAETPLDTMLQVLEAEPERPSLLDPRVGPDLETCCLKCLEKDPRRRYPSALALAEDLERFLAGEPVQARPVGGGERLWRWCRRKPVVAGLLAALVLAVAGGFAGVTWQWRRAEDNLREAEHQRDRAESQSTAAEEAFRLAHQAVQDFYTRLSEDRLANVPGLQPVRKELLETALRYYQAFVERRGDDPRVRADLAAAHFRVAVITSHIGSKDEALQSYERARTLYESLVHDDPTSTTLRAELAQTYNNRGIVFEAVGKPQAAIASLQEARKLTEQLLIDRPGDVALQSDLASTLNNLGALYAGTGQPTTALAVFKQARTLREELARARPDEAAFQSRLADLQDNIGILQGRLGHEPQALEAFQRACTLREELVRLHPAVSRYLSELASSYRHLGNWQRRNGQPVEGLRTMQKGHATLERAARANPRVTQLQSDLAASHTNLGLAHRAQKHPAEALACFQQARTIQAELVRLHPNVPRYQSELGRSHFHLGVTYAASRQYAEAVRAYEEALAIQEKLVRAQADNPDYHGDLGETLTNLGQTLAKTGRSEDARVAFRRAAVELQQAQQKAPEVVRYRQSLQKAERGLAEVERTAEKANGTARP
jgi:serine/threonine-protein kinase